MITAREELAARRPLLAWLTPARAPFVVAAILVAPSFAWIVLDRAIWVFDTAWYGDVSVELWAKLRSDPHAWYVASLHAFGEKPPAIAWFGQFFVPLSHVFGAVEPALLFSTVLWQGASLLLLYVTGLRLTQGRVLPVLAGVLFVAAAPLFVWLTHFYFVEPIQTFSIVWVLFAMVSAPRWHLPFTAAQVVAAMSLGLLAKISTPAYVFVPALIAIVASARAAQPRPRLSRDSAFLISAVGAALLALGTIAWYRINLRDALDYLHSSSTSTLWGEKRSFLSNVVFRFRHLDHAVLLPYFDWAFGAVLLVVLGYLAARRGSLRRLDYEWLCVLGSLAAVLIAFIGLALQINDQDRLLDPIIAPAALVLVGVLGKLRSRLPAAAAVVVLAAQFGFVTAQSLSASVPRSAAYSLVVAPPAGKSSVARQLDRIIRFTCTRTPGGSNVVGVDYGWLSHTNLQFLARAAYARQGIWCYWSSIGFAQRDPAEAWKTLDSGFPYFVTVDFANVERLPQPYRALALRTLASPDPFNRTDVAVYRRALRSPKWVIVPSLRRLGLVVFRRSDR